MNETETKNPFEELANQEKAKMPGAATPKRRGRPPTKKPPIQKTKESHPQVGMTKRKPVGLRKNTNNADPIKGFKIRWVNDHGDRPHVFKEGWWEPVIGRDGKPVTRNSKLGGKRQILMKLREDLYEEDQQAKYSKWNKDAQERLKPREGEGYYTPKIKGPN